jgi:hypothetical protein
MAKYKNKKIDVEGILFDSKAEASRYLYLKKLYKAGIIHNLEMQKKFEIIPAQYKTYKRYGRGGKQLKDGKVCLEKSAAYVADFVYTDSNGDTVVEDVKSKPTRTKDFVLKRKLMLQVHNIRIREV